MYEADNMWAKVKHIRKQGSLQSRFPFSPCQGWTYKAEILNIHFDYHEGSVACIAFVCVSGIWALVQKFHLRIWCYRKDLWYQRWQKVNTEGFCESERIPLFGLFTGLGFWQAMLQSGLSVKWNCRLLLMHQLIWQSCLTGGWVGARRENHNCTVSQGLFHVCPFHSRRMSKHIKEVHYFEIWYKHLWKIING